MTPIVAILIVVLGFLGWEFWRVAHAYLEFRGKRVITCPETEEPAAVELAAWHVAAASTFRRPKLRLQDCSRWREVAPCDGACLARIEEAPQECLLLTILSKWYKGKLCTCCGNAIGPIGHFQHNPCLMSPDRRILEWKDIPAENIPRTLETYAPVCWNCLVAETHIN